MEVCEIPRWQLIKSTLNNLSYEAFVQAVETTPESVCLDVRRPEEFASGHISGAQNINYLSPNLADLLEELDPFKTYYIYCRTSRRSLRVCLLLRNMRFKNIFHLENGVRDLL